jgi:hypothetical protein
MIRRRRIAALFSGAALLVGMAGCGSSPGDLADLAVGTWVCGISRGDGPADELTVEVSDDGTFVLVDLLGPLVGGGDLTGTWERDGDQLAVETEPDLGSFRYEGVTDDPEHFEVLEDGEFSGAFDVEIDGERVLIDQTTWSNGEDTPADEAFHLDCEKQSDEVEVG